jgi:hypothetical protein
MNIPSEGIKLFRTTCLAFCVLSMAALASADPAATTTPTTTCYPPFDSRSPQFIIGYGSLIDSQSKDRIYPNTSENMPVTVDGFQRGWFSMGPDVGYSATFLGIKPNPAASFNGVMFQLLSLNALSQYDQREHSYCRVQVAMANIHSLTQQPVAQGQYWIYMPPADNVATPTETYPIIESYIDIFLSGCLDMQNKYHLPNYAEDCITTTTDWSKHWINDRIYPRRPLANQPKATAIDKLLSKKLPNYFDNIELE